MADGEWSEVRILKHEYVLAAMAIASSNEEQTPVAECQLVGFAAL